MKLYLYLSALVATTTAASIPNGCPGITDSLGDKPESLLKYFQEKVCGQDKCEATITDNTGFLEDKLFPELFKEITKRLEIPAGKEKQFQEISGEVKSAVKKGCSEQNGNSKICDQDGVVQYGKCALKAAEPVLSKGGDQKPSQEQCQKLTEVFSDDQLWSKTFHGYVDQFANECKNGNGGGESGEGEDDEE